MTKAQVILAAKVLLPPTETEDTYVVHFMDDCDLWVVSVLRPVYNPLTRKNEITPVGGDQVRDSDGKVFPGNSY
jgi:hypothetical protein